MQEEVWGTNVPQICAWGRRGLPVVGSGSPLCCPPWGLFSPAGATCCCRAGWESCLLLRVLRCPGDASKARMAAVKGTSPCCVPCVCGSSRGCCTPAWQILAGVCASGIGGGGGYLKPRSVCFRLLPGLATSPAAQVGMGGGECLTGCYAQARQTKAGVPRYISVCLPFPSGVGHTEILY